MQLESIKLSGFRGHGEAISLSVESSTTTIIGRNDAGKSSILEALDVFFGGAKLELSDFTVGTVDPVEISCTFSQLPPTVVLDADRSTALDAEYLLDGQSNLTLIKSWSRGKLTSPNVYALAAHPYFGEDVDLLNSKLPALKLKAKAMEIPDEDISDRRTSSGYRQAIWKKALQSGEATLREMRVPLSSEDGKSVGAALDNYIPVFHLFRADRPGTEADKLAQDPASAAIKAVLAEHEDDLKALSATIHSKVSTILEDVVDRLSEVAPDLAASLNPTDPAPVWNKAFSNLHFVDENGVPLSKRGSGTRRLVLLSFFRATAEKEAPTDASVSDEYHRGVITAIEEPETALHADLQTDIVYALRDVGDLPHRQVLLTTHSSNLIRLVPHKSIRYITGGRLARKCVQVEDGDPTELLTELNKSLGIFTDHNVRCFLLIEGRNDVTGLKNLSEVLESMGVDGVRSLSQLEADGRVCFMPIGGGGSASLWESNLSPFRRHEVHIMDSDRLSSTHPLKNEMVTLQGRADDLRHVYVLERREMENYLTQEAILDAYGDVSGFREAFNRVSSNLGSWEYVDVPMLCAEAMYLVNAPEGSAWAQLSPETRASKESRAKKRLARAFGHESMAASISHEESDLLSALRQITTLAGLNAS